MKSTVTGCAATTLTTPFFSDTCGAFMLTNLLLTVAAPVALPGPEETTDASTLSSGPTASSSSAPIPSTAPTTRVDARAALSVPSTRMRSISTAPSAPAQSVSVASRAIGTRCPPAPAMAATTFTTAGFSKPGALIAMATDSMVSGSPFVGTNITGFMSSLTTAANPAGRTTRGAVAAVTGPPEPGAGTGALAVTGAAASPPTRIRKLVIVATTATALTCFQAGGSFFALGASGAFSTGLLESALSISVALEAGMVTSMALFASERTPSTNCPLRFAFSRCSVDSTSKETPPAPILAPFRERRAPSPISLRMASSISINMARPSTLMPSKSASAVHEAGAASASVHAKCALSGASGTRLFPLCAAIFEVSVPRAAILVPSVTLASSTVSVNPISAATPGTPAITTAGIRTTA